jgi:hypothetical protein
MKHTFFLLLALALNLRAQDAEAPAALPAITVTTQTVTTVEPLTLSQEQMAGIIAAVQAGGISASVPITSSNLSSVYLYEQDGHFVVNIKLK